MPPLAFMPSLCRSLLIEPLQHSKDVAGAEYLRSETPAFPGRGFKS
jgi:hypothetical protein